MVTLGVISDTHIPDRAHRLDPRVMPIFRSAGVEAILHAGDVSSPGVLAQLGEVATVYAVRGNRDWLWLRNLPVARRLDFSGVTIGLTHGHGNLWNYLKDRIYFMRQGYHPERLLPRLLAEFPDVRVIVFGHGHSPLNQWMGVQLLFNPGSPHVPGTEDLTPSVGLLHISGGSEVRGEIIRL
jgi:putative phosphoesterase